MARRFQSTPPSKERGDRSCASPRRPRRCFNPRPPPKRGATTEARKARLVPDVSIHAPLQREGRPSCRLRRNAEARFQSTPPSKERGDNHLRSPHRLRRCFNPRPPPKRGATPARTRRQGYPPVSIHAPLQREGRPPASRCTLRPRRVSIHAPLQREGRLALLLNVLNFLFVSIHAPLQREGRLRGRAQPASSPVFQSTPPSKERGDRSCCALERPGPGFNPRPPPKRGATLRLDGFDFGLSVSIHAPLQREGRPARRLASARRTSFNPRPPPKRGATRSGVGEERRVDVSIHAPLQREGRL